MPAPPSPNGLYCHGIRASITRGGDRVADPPCLHRDADSLSRGVSRLFLSWAAGNPTRPSIHEDHQRGESMAKYASTVTLTCAECRALFTLTEAAYARRRHAYGDRLLCQRCLGDIWLRMQPQEKRKLLDQDISATA